MILQALHQLAEKEELVGDPDFEWKPVGYLVNLDEKGNFLGFTSTYYTPPQEGKKKPKPVAKRFLVPMQPSRSGTKAPPYFMVDNAKYVFGKPTKDKAFSEAEGQEKSGWFFDMVRSCAETTGSDGAAAVLAFLTAVRNGTVEFDFPEDCKSNDNFAFVVEPDQDRLLHERKEIADFWRSLRSEVHESEQEFVCLVSGKAVPTPGLFPQLKRVPGGSTSGVGLVSFNQKAFWSYGWENNENAAVSREAAEACATALNRLLDPAFPDPHEQGATLPVRNLRLSGDTVLVYWSPGAKSREVLDYFGALFEPDPALVKEAYQSIWHGKAPKLDDASAFYALILTGTQGRAIVRDWFETTLERALEHIAAYFDDIAIVRNTPPPKDGGHPPALSLGRLLESLAPHGKRDEIPAPLAAQFVHAALSGAPYPFSVLQRALERTRAEIGKTDWLDLARRDARAALIKATLSRTKQLELSPAMDVNNKNPGYLFGRLMAVIERMQELALGNVNASVVDRFFAGASATPAAVYPRLLKNLRHHADKAKDAEKSSGAAHWLEKEIDAIMAGIDGFPPHLDLVQQGLFVLGYHHERHYLWLPKEERQKLIEASNTTVNA